jgi:hypothetical protein
MAYDKDLEARIDGATKTWKKFGKKKMFGGICYLLNGNMAFGIWQDYAIVRVGDDDVVQKLIKKPNTRPFDITGKRMKGWVMVKGTGIKTKTQLSKWLEMGRDFAKTLPAK